MDLTANAVGEHVEAYPDVQPLSTVEEEHVEMLPGMFARGDYGWRDAEWVVQWYFRRYLGGFPDRERRTVEEAYGENSFEDVRAAIRVAVEGVTTRDRVAALTELSGVDVGVASAFCQFVAPDRYLAVDERLWGVLRATGELDGDYTADLSLPDYERYLSACRAVADRCDCSLYDLYRTLWVIGEERAE